MLYTPPGSRSGRLRRKTRVSVCSILLTVPGWGGRIGGCGGRKRGKRGEKGRERERKRGKRGEKREEKKEGKRKEREGKRRIYDCVQSYPTYSPTGTDWRISQERLGLERWEYACWKESTQGLRWGLIITDK